MTTDLNCSLLPWQEEVWNAEERFLVVVAGRRCGKTEKAAWRLLIRALTDQKHGHRFYVAPTQGQARDVMWKKLLELGSPVIKSTHVNNLEITLINDEVLSLKGADRPETMRGVKLADLILDEYADMKPFVWEEILRPACTDLQAGALFIGTPMGRNHFYDLYQYADMSGDPEWRAFHYTTEDNPLLARSEIESAKRSMSSYAFRQEYLASFAAQGSEVFHEDWVKFSKKDPGEGSTFIAIDPAGFEEVGMRGKKKKKSKLDNTAIAVVKVNSDGWYVNEIIYGRWDVKETAKKIFDAVIKYQPVSVGIERGIAQQAIMSPLNDLCRRYQKFFRVDLLSHGNKKKTDRIIWALQGRFENGYVTLNEGDWNTEFLDQLFQFPDDKTHDDLVDALAYIDQLATESYFTDWEADEVEIDDDIIGY